jgi:oxalate decarboxylase
MMVRPKSPEFGTLTMLTFLGNFEGGGTTFMVDDWIAHTPRAILAQNFGVNESAFDIVPKTDPYILNATVTTANDTGAESGLYGNSS